MALEVDIWVAPAGTAVPPRLLDAPAGPERERAATLPGPASARFVLGRALLRGALAERLACAPGEVALRATCPSCGGDHGRVTVAAPGPWLPGAPGGVHVSLTRSGPVVAVALCAGAAVGIDAELRSAVVARPVADVVLSPPEVRRLGTLPRPLRERALARTWVRKEAALKAWGTGLRADPAGLEVLRVPGRSRGVDAVVRRAAAVPPGTAPADVEPDGTPHAVAVVDLRLGRGRVGAVGVVTTGDPGDAARRGVTVRHHDGASLLDPGRR